MQSTGESMGMGRGFATAYWKAELGAGWKHLPFGKPVYLSLPTVLEPQLANLVAQLTATDCTVIGSPGMAQELVGLDRCAAAEVDVGQLGLVVALGQSPEELALLRRAIDAGVPYISTTGGLRGLMLALREGVPDLRLDVADCAGEVGAA